MAHPPVPPAPPSANDEAANRHAHRVLAGASVAIWAIFSVALSAAWAAGASSITTAAYLAMEAVGTATLVIWLVVLRGMRGTTSSPRH